jgi:hypothetical protein
MPQTSLNSLSESAIESNGPDIRTNPESAFFPLRLDKFDNRIKPSFQTRVCVKKFIICTEWQLRTIFFDDLSWFKANGFGLKKIEHIK